MKLNCILFLSSFILYLENRSSERWNTTFEEELEPYTDLSPVSTIYMKITE